ncbi:hypothetical protein SUGI_0424290 [Cryptomeria japonica]|uniref:pentatricopeptide repeat-containing protein At5g46580, chloroplastic-like n=1 Tax=Cryptomeria japonica TaxID=3369 RepID=UPI002408D60A|nr:pentatricopeptide repeat-containing protein At5g46580, chloroplastic-like [Cryptomeria japonica]GLJ22539.1 hypothetical protein SUGI_0424290 [Cryptomeria japonica]
MSLASTVPSRVPSTANAGTHSYHTHYPNAFHNLDSKPKFTHKNNPWRLPSSSISFQVNSSNVEIKANTETPSIADQLKTSVKEFLDTEPKTPSMADQLKPFAKEFLDTKPPFNDAHEHNQGIAKYKSKSVWVNPSRPRTAALTLHRHNRRQNHKRSPKFEALRLLAQKLDSCQPTQEAVFEVLDSVGYIPIPKDAVITINMIRDSEKVYYFIQWLNKNEEFEMNSIVYNVAMKVLRKGRQWDRVEELLKEMLDREIEPDNITYSTVISCATQCNLFHKAVEWFERMKETGCLPDEVTYTAMLDAFSRNGQVQEALNLYERGRADGWVPDNRAFATLLKMFSIAGDSDAVLEAFQEMKTLGVKPDLIAYNTVLGALAKAGKPSAAKLLFIEMTGAGVIPSQITVTCLIRVYGKARWANDALKLWNIINNEGWTKDMMLYNTLLGMCADLGLMEEAAAIFEEMSQSDQCKPDQWSYTSMIDLYAKRCQIEEVNRTFSEMMEAGFKPTVVICTCLIQCYGKAKRFDDVVKIFNLLLDEGISPDDKLCGSLISVLTFCEKEEFGKVLECIEKANPKLGLCVKMLQDENIGSVVLQEEIRTVFNYALYDTRKHFCNCLIDLCYKFNFPERAHYLLYLGTIFGIYKNLDTKTPSEWCLNLRNLSLKSALTAFDGWISSVSKSLEDGEEMPPLLGIHTGRGTNKQSSQEGLATFFESHLKELNSPFEKSTERVGWFLATRDAAISWLQSRNSSILVTT